MEDKELLRLAAEAAGYLINGGQYEAPYVSEKGVVYTLWNPLQDDRDAFRLAVRLGLQWEPASEHVNVGSDLMLDGEWVIAWEKYADHRGDKLETTRRAIVRAAAETGKNKTK